MKWITFYIAFLFLNITSFAEGHFVLSYTGNGLEHMNLYVVTATINGTNLDVGDEIAVFDGTICCGKAILTQPIVTTDPNTFITLKASKADPGISEGYTSGNVISYKFWDSSKSIEISSLTTQYIDPENDATIPAPTFTPEGSATVKLSYEAITNQAPVANAGPNQTVNEGAVVTLNGSASSDQDNNTLTYTWSAPTGITLSSTTAAKPTFTAPEVMTDQNYTFSLIVNDGTVNSIADQVVITIKQVNKIPTANAGIDQSLNEGVTVTLDGSASLDPDNNSLTYSWTVPSGIVLSSTTAAKPTFTAPEVMTDQTYTISLIVNDGIVSSAADQVIITVKQVNKAPVANAGPDQYLDEGVLVALNGSASSDPDNNILTYLWSAPEGISLSSATVAKPTFTAPEVMANQTYTFSLIVNDGTANSTGDQVFIAVKQVNKAPMANAGSDQSVEKNTLYTLDGTSSIDPDGDVLTYLWTAPIGIALSSNSVARPTFTTPAITTVTNFTFTLTVSDGKLSSLSDQVVITLKQSNQAPEAKAGIDQSIDEGSLVALDGSASSDPDGDPLVYTWVAPSGITLNSTSAAKPTFTAPEVMTNQTYTFSLIVNDGTVSSIADQVVITVRQVNKAPVANAGTDNTAIEGSIVTLNGSSSYDLDNNNTISYLWSAPVGIILSSTTIINPKFTAPNLLTDQDFVFSLIVNDGIVNSIADQVTIIVKHNNGSPVANAGTNQTVNEGVLVTLDGSASTDPDNNALTYKWSAPAEINLSSTTAAKPTFTAPEVMTDRTYTFSLTVNDGIANSTADVIITVKQINKVPMANAGPDQSVNKGVLVTLDGSASSDPDNNPLTYKWSAPSEITLSSTTEAKPTFTAPDVTTDRTFAFSLVVNDGTVNSTSDQLFITVRQFNKAPVLTSIKSYNVNEDTPQEFLIEGSDFENDPINFSIENLPSFLRLAKKTNTSAILSGTFTNQYVGVNTFKLDLSDGISSTQETISISVTNVDDAPYVKDSIDNVSVNMGATDLVIDLKPVFADDDKGDILNFSVTSNTNDKVVTAKITGTDLTLSFSKEYFGLAQIILTATSNGKVAQSKFTVEVKIPTGIEMPYDDTEVSIYPNPTEGDVHLKFDRIPEDATWINVYTETGRLIMKSLIKSDEKNLDFKGYVPGIYFIQIAQKKQKTFKVVLK